MAAASIDLTTAEIVELNRCLGSGAAAAAKRFTREREDERRRHDYQYFAFVAHELRNPLSSLRLAWDGVKPHADGLASTRAISVLDRSLERITGLIEQTLTEMRLRALDAGSALVQERLLLAELLAEVRDESALDAEGRHITVEIEVGDDSLSVSGDRRLLRSALTNVLRNGIKFSKPGARIVMRASRLAPRLLIEIADGCGGIPTARIESLFQSFTQAGADRSGFGLGLAIAKQAVEAHDGTITVRNDPPHGCIFLIALPA
jgi:signal transduction histidine kinase